MARIEPPPDLLDLIDIRDFQFTMMHTLHSDNGGMKELDQLYLSQHTTISKHILNKYINYTEERK